MCYGFTSVFMSDSGEHQEYSDSVNRWKQVCFQCGYLKVLRDYSSVARQVMDTAAQAERVLDIKEKQEDSVQDLRAVSEWNADMKRSMQYLQQSVSMLQGAGLECPQ